MNNNKSRALEKIDALTMYAPSPKYCVDLKERDAKKGIEENFENKENTDS